MAGLRGPYVNPYPLLLPQFKKEDARWRVISSSAQTSLRRTTYSTALLDSLARAEEHQVSEEDRTNIGTILITISELSFILSDAYLGFYATRQRRKLALSTLGLHRQADRAFRLCSTGSRPFTVQ